MSRANLIIEAESGTFGTFEAFRLTLSVPFCRTFTNQTFRIELEVASQQKFVALR